LVGPPVRVMAQLSRPYAERETAAGERLAVETWDVASVLLEFASGASGLLALNRAAWGRKGRIALQVFGSAGSITFDQERMNEFQLHSAGDPASTAGFRTVLAGPQHAPYDRFIPAPGHGLGFNDLKTTECHELLAAIAGQPARVVDFEAGLAIERAVHAMARSHHEGRWVTVEPAAALSAEARP
jgi:predicted dehydrogenase